MGCAKNVVLRRLPESLCIEPINMMSMSHPDVYSHIRDGLNMKQVSVGNKPVC